MKDDNKIDILRYENIEIIDDRDFLERIKENERLKEYANLELMRKKELQEVIQREKIDMYNESVFDYVKTINAINEKGQIEKSNIINGQTFTINYQKNTLNIIDKKAYEGHFERVKEYNYFLKDVGILDAEIKVILNNISKRDKKNNCDFLLYVLANREKKLKTKKEQLEKIDNLFKLWNITEKYYSYRQYKIYLNIYEELYINYLRDNLNINVAQYESIKTQMKEIKKEILKGE